MSNSPILQGISIFKPIIQAGILAVTPVFSGTYTDEMGNPFTIQLRGSLSTERRVVPNVLISFRPGSVTFFPGNNMVGFDPTTGLYMNGFYAFDSALRYTVEGRNEAERQWLMDSLTTAFTGLVFEDPVTGDFAVNNLGDYLGSQGIVVKGWAPPEYPTPVLPDPRPEGQVYEATLALNVDVSFIYETPGVSAASVQVNNGWSMESTFTVTQLGPQGGTSTPVVL